MTRKEYKAQWYQKNKAKVRAKQKEYKARTKAENHAWRERHLKRSYDMSTEDYDSLLFSQDYACAICSTPQAKLAKRLAVDHCHDTGDVRGLLCSNCNRAIGLLCDDRHIILKAAAYLE